MINYTEVLKKEEYSKYQLAKIEEYKKSEDPKLRMNAYKVLGFTEEALKDEESIIRNEAYKALGYTEEAKKDDHPWIRREAHRNLGWTEEALTDRMLDIRKEARGAFGYTKENLERHEETELQAFRFFYRCSQILKLDHIKFTFTEKEAKKIRKNGMIVNKKIIIGE